MRIIITEEQKKKLFTPKGLSNNENNRFIQWNKEQPIKDGKPINQYDIDGNKQGYWEHFYDNGKRDYNANFKNGQYHGYCEFYHPNGKLQSKGSYINGKFNGVWNDFDNKGRLWNKVTYKNGKRIKELPITESKKKLFTPKNLDSRYKEWNEEQSIIDGVRINQYDLDGNKQGYWETPYDKFPGKKLIQKGNYVNDKKEGEWVISYPNGKIYLFSRFKNGERLFGGA